MRRRPANLHLTLALVLAGCGAMPHPLAPVADPALASPTAPARAATSSLAPTLAPGAGTRALVAASVLAPTLRLEGFTAESFWAPGHLAAWVAGLATAREDRFASGAWSYGGTNPVPYQVTLGAGLATSSYDPKRFLASLGLPDPLSTGRGDVELFHAWKPTGYDPGPRYLPGPPALAAGLQDLLLGGSRLSAGAVKGLDGMLDRAMLGRLTKNELAEPFPYGRDEDVVPGAVQNIGPAARYAGVAARRRRQHGWDSGFHEGGPRPTANRPTEAFGTYEIALAQGFTAAQAKRIANEDIAVDDNTTHYRGADGKTRQTSSGGGKGDLHWHYNRAPVGKEDTRITAARTHLERALRFARAGRYDDAEEELGVGLHSLQDMTAHAQITPLNHALLGEFPDIEAYNPVGVFEAAVVTEGYLRRYLDALVPAPAAPAPRSVALPQGAPALAAALVVGDAVPEDQNALQRALATYPEGLLSTLLGNDVHVYLAASGTTPVSLGFAPDLDGDGQVTPGKWVDLDGDGQAQPWETEGKLPDGRDWSTLPAAYDGTTRRIFLADDQLANADALLRHELAHALDDLWLSDPTLAITWQQARERQLRLARRANTASFADGDRDEFIADLIAK